MDASEQQLPQQLGPFVLEARIASGRLAGLFRAVDRRTSQRVLLRSLPQALVEDPNRAAQAQQRIARALEIRHPHVSRTLEVIKGKRSWWLVLEPLPGGTLEDRMAAEPLPRGDAIRIAAQVARGLQAIHASGRPHGAIRPANLWINQSADAGLQATLLQYPLSADGYQSPQGSLSSEFASASFQAPELRSSNRPSAAGDIYSLGRLLEYLLSDQSASDSGTVSKRESSPPQLTTLIARLTAEDPARRPNMLTLLAELERLEQRLAQEQVSATAADGKSPRKPIVGGPEHATVELPTRSYDESPALPVIRSKGFAPEPSLDDSQSVRRILAQRRERRVTRSHAIAALAVSLLLVAAGLAAWWSITSRGTAESPGMSTASPTVTNHPASPETDGPTDNAHLASDSASVASIWASPTSGEPVEWAHVPSGTQFLLVIRPAELMEQPAASQILEGLGPLGDLLRHDLVDVVGLPLEQMEQVTVALLDRGADPYATALVIRTTAPVPLEPLLTAWQQPAADSAGKALYRRDDLGYWAPQSDGTSAGTDLVIAPWNDLLELVSQADQPILLRGDIEGLCAYTDQTRLLNLVCTQNFLYAGGKDLFVGTTAPLKQGIRWFLGEQTQALAISAQLTTDALFLELRLAGTPAERPAEAKQGILDRLQELPHRVSSYLLSTGISDYSRPLLERFPRMLDLLVRYTRGELEDRRTLYRAYLPIDAAANLAWGTRLTLLEGNQSASPESVRQPVTQTALEQLRASTSLSFPRDTLETAITLLSEAIHVPMEILGQDLQAEGITRNQSFGIDARDLPAGVILHQILFQANAEGKLVCVLTKDEQGKERLKITTRAAAQQRNETPLDLLKP